MVDIDNHARKKRLLRIGDVAELTSLGKSTINLWVTQKRFPLPIKVSATLKVWDIEDILGWIDTLKSKNTK